MSPGWRSSRRRQGHPGWCALLLAGVCALAAGCATPGAVIEHKGSVVRVLGSWEGPELAAFRAMVAPFEQRTGIRVEYTATRDLQGVLSTSIEAGDPPDVAGLPGPGFMLDLARQGHLVDLEDVIDVPAYKRDTAPAFVDLGTVDGHLVGVFIKASVKGLMWYDPEVYRLGISTTWADLEHRAMMSDEPVRPWCVGLASGASSGWPGTDWIEDFVLRQSGPAIYDGWVAGSVRWTSPEIRRAFISYGSVVADGAVAGGSEAAIRTYFADAGDGLFTDPPRCLFMHQGSFMTTFLEDSVSRLGGTYDMMPFPDIDPRYSGALIGAGDLLALISDSAPARDFLRYLVTDEAQSIWVRRGGALSGNRKVTDYPDEISRREAELLTSASVFRFDASDSMPDEMNVAFWQAVLEYTADPTQLDSILRHLDAVQVQAYG